MDSYSKKIKNKKTEKQKELLMRVGFIFSIKDNKNEINLLCEDYGISYKKNKKVLEKSSVDFIKMKILFLLESN